MTLSLPGGRVSDSATQQNLDRIAQVLGQFAGRIFFGSGSPENVVTADIGALYLRADGGPGTSLYVKEANPGTNTGWQPK